MKNTFEYLPHEKLYKIFIGLSSRLCYTLVDQEGFNIATTTCKGVWSNCGGYTMGQVKGKARRLHRIIIAAPDYYDVDHINGDKLDNRLCNLRLATESQNTTKAKLSTDNTSGYKGVSFQWKTKKWKAQVYVNNKCSFLGYFLTKEEAALAYNTAAKIRHGEFAYQNVITPS